MGNKGKVLFAAAFVIFLGSTLFFLKINPSYALTSTWIDEKKFGEMCVGQVAPASKNLTREESNEILSNEENNEEMIKNEIKKEIVKEEKDDSGESTLTVSGDPLVIIYHTHSSESYMPYKESNYHRVAETGTVRDAGNILETELKKKGINVIHDKTIHDRPSYNESYDRSLATIKSLIKKYPTAVYIIDLHRDAATASAKEGKYIELDGKRVAKFSLVVGKANENYVELYSFAKSVSQRAETMYKGYGGPIIEKDYNYNEYVSNNYLLLEMGNNKNTIEEARLSAKYFADVMAAVIKANK